MRSLSRFNIQQLCLQDSHTIRKSIRTNLVPRLFLGKRKEPGNEVESAPEKHNQQEKSAYVCGEKKKLKPVIFFTSLSDTSDNGKWFEPRGISYLFSVIVRVRVVFKPWRNGLASRRKFWTCVQLAFRLANHLRLLATTCVDFGRAQIWTQVDALSFLPFGHPAQVDTS